MFFSVTTENTHDRMLMFCLFTDHRSCAIGMHMRFHIADITSLSMIMVFPSTAIPIAGGIMRFMIAQIMFFLMSTPSHGAGSVHQNHQFQLLLGPLHLIVDGGTNRYIPFIWTDTFRSLVQNDFAISIIDSFAILKMMILRQKSLIARLSFKTAFRPSPRQTTDCQKHSQQQGNKAFGTRFFPYVHLCCSLHRKKANSLYSAKLSSSYRLYAKGIFPFIHCHYII